MYAVFSVLMYVMKLLRRIVQCSTIIVITLAVVFIRVDDCIVKNIYDIVQLLLFKNEI